MPTHSFGREELLRKRKIRSIRRQQSKRRRIISTTDTEEIRYIMATAIEVTLPPNTPPRDPSVYSDFDARSPSEESLSIGFRSSISSHNDVSSITSQGSPESTAHRRRATLMSAIDISCDFAAGSRRDLTDHVKQVELQRDMLRQTVASLLERQALQEQRHERKVRMLESELERMQMRYASRTQRNSYVPDVKALECKAEEMRQKARAMEQEREQSIRGLQSLEKSLDTAREERDTLRKWLEGHGAGLPDFMIDDDPSDDGNDTNSVIDADREARRANHALVQQISEQLRTNEQVRTGLSKAIAQNEEQRKTLNGQISEIHSKLRLLERTIDQTQRSEEEWTGSSYEEHQELLRRSHNDKLKRRSACGRAMKYSRDDGRRCSSDTSKSEGSRLLALLSPLSPSRNRFSDFLAPGSDFENAQLQSRVRELEQALREAEFEMKTVVNRMNMAQIEVAELQADREHALRQLRKYQEQGQPQRPVEKPTRPVSVQSRISMFTISREPQLPKIVATPDEGVYYE